MITHTTPHDDGLRFWYVALPSALQGNARREASAKLKTAGFKARSGMKTAFPARMLAMKIEKATGIEMEIGKHDYL